ncbi:MAG TPA: hypothetical protein VGM86_15560 [Thermoanaerobaculia bacterium]|jgi:hypothetical protein
MRKQNLKKLTIARETLRRLEDQGLQGVLGGSRFPSIESICICDTDLCVSAGHTGCTACNS